MEIFGEAHNEGEWKKLYISMLKATVATSMFEKQTFYGVFGDDALSKPGVIVVSLSLDNVPDSKSQYMHAVMSRPGISRHPNQDEIYMMLKAIDHIGNPYYEENSDGDTPITHFYWPYPFSDQYSHDYLRQILRLEEYT